VRTEIDVVTTSSFGGATAAMINVSSITVYCVFLHGLSKRKFGARTEMGVLLLFLDGDVEWGTKFSDVGREAIAVSPIVSACGDRVTYEGIEKTG
jgi:hypothetical protein